MHIRIKLAAQPAKNTTTLYIADRKTKWESSGFTRDEASYISKKLKADEKFIVLNRFTHHIFIHVMDEDKGKPTWQTMEKMRNAGCKAAQSANAHRYETMQIAALAGDRDRVLAAAEGCALGSYEFLKYRTEKKDGNTLTTITLAGKLVSARDAEVLQITVDAVMKARDMVNEPQSYLDAVTFAAEMTKLAREAGIKTEVLSKKQIESLKMGGLLAVNMGSPTPPTFTIMEWKPSGRVNKQPLVLIGKGVVYDTGGLSLKPTPNSMDTMKCDMAGGAAVSCAMYAIAKAKLPYHVIALVPATDNRPGGNAYTPGDVIRMYDGKTVEVLNTDAEGRMLLGDALAYAKKYKPSLVLDFATLTGAAAAAIGPYGIVCMGTAGEADKNALKNAGNQVYERLVEFPFWDEYGKLIRSDIADMKNIGGPIAGAITAGKFLEKFIDYDWMHFDIAGPAYVNAADSYRGKNGTGTGVRLIFEFVRAACGKKA